MHQMDAELVVSFLNQQDTAASVQQNMDRVKMYGRALTSDGSNIVQSHSGVKTRARPEAVGGARGHGARGPNFALGRGVQALVSALALPGWTKWK